MQARLPGVHRVTLSCPGVLLQPGQLSESVCLRPGVADLLAEMCHMGLEVFLLSQVSPRRTRHAHAMHKSWRME